MFRIACGLPSRAGWGLTPSEFWALCPQEWWWLYEVNVGTELKDKEDTKARLKRLYFESRGTPA